VLNPRRLLDEGHGELLVRQQSGCELDGGQEAARLATFKASEHYVHTLLLEKRRKDLLVFAHGGQAAQPVQNRPPGHLSGGEAAQEGGQAGLRPFSIEALRRSVQVLEQCCGDRRAHHVVGHVTVQQEHSQESGGEGQEGLPTRVRSSLLSRRHTHPLYQPFKS
jgi:hypothetical protein